MEKMSNDELRNALIAKKMIDNAGAVNPITVNCISGVHTWPLLNEVRDLLLNDVDAMEELRTFLNEVYVKGQCDIMIGILKILYNICSLLIPDEIQMIFYCGIQELKEFYLYEFLEDFQDMMYDFWAEIELS